MNSGNCKMIDRILNSNLQAPEQKCQVWEVISDLRIKAAFNDTEFTEKSLFSVLLDFSQKCKANSSLHMFYFDQKIKGLSLNHITSCQDSDRSSNVLN
jgi:hypothetical protein